MAATPEAATVPSAVAPEALYRKLSPGPGMPAGKVAAHQCVRIHRAMIELAGDGGYDRVTMRQLSNLAGVSTRTFYAHFENGKEECFLRTYERVVQVAAARIVASQGGERDWVKRLRLAFAAFAREIQDKPRAARLALVEAYAAGPAALESTRRTQSTFEAMLSESFSRAPDGIEVPSIFTKAIVAGVSHVARARLLAGKERELPELADELVNWTLSFHSEAAAELAELDGYPVSLSSPSAPDIPARLQQDGQCAREDDRTLILNAVAKLAASEGYGQLTVPRIRAAAGVPRRSFNTYFEGVEDCFFAALELRTVAAFQRALSHAAGNSWPSNTYQAIAALCTHISRDPVLAKLAFSEISAPGSSGMRCRESIMAEFAERFRASAPSEQRPERLSTEASVGAAWGILHHCVTSGQAQQLPRIAPAFAFIMLAPTIGATASASAIGHERGDDRWRASA